jgi:hypothetical protein
VNEQDLVSLRTAADWFPHRRGQRVSVKSIQTWIETGSHGVLLEARSSGGEWFTTREWVETFLRAVEDTKKPAPPPTPARKPGRPRKS